jgi:hypothetical protein
MKNDEVKVRAGRHIVDFGDGERLKSDIALTTSLSPNVINDVVAKVKVKLIKRQQPVIPRDIAATTHFTMVEMGMKKEAEQYIKFITDRYEGRSVPKERVKFIKCEYCNTSNDFENKFCVGCGHGLSKDKTDSKLV